MTKDRKKIIEKFYKQDGICNICGESRELSEDHIPPKSCPPAKNVLISKLLYKIQGKRGFKPRDSQNGVTFKTICQTCKNDLGKYDRALCEFSQKIESFVNTNLELPDVFQVECYPNAILRSILGHLLAAKTETDAVVIDNLIRPCILNSSLPVHDNIHVFYWVYPYEKTIIMRDFGMPAVRGKLQKPGFFNMIKFYPTAFLITHQLPFYEGLMSLHQFNKLSPTDKANIKINLRFGKSSTWPEECIGLENYLLFGRAANDSVYAIPQDNKKKSFSRKGKPDKRK